MKTEWDYTKLADAYLERPPYAGEALAELYSLAGLAGPAQGLKSGIQYIIEGAPSPVKERP